MRTLPAAAAVLFAALAVAADPAPVVVKFGKLSAEVPKDWKSEKPNNRLRSHQFRLPSGTEGVADAELYVMPESNPDPDKSFPRWKASFVPPDGKELDDVAKVSKFQVDGGEWKVPSRVRPLAPTVASQNSFQVRSGISPPSRPSGLSAWVA